MKRKRLSILLSLICMVTSILSVQPLLAKEELVVHKSLADISQGRTTDSQIEVDDTQTTPSAIDITELSELIAKAEEISTQAIIGTTPGAYDILDKIKFDSSITEAKETLETANTQEGIDEAVIKLTQAIKLFEESRIKSAEGDVDADGIINVADLALVSYYYQAKEGEENWPQAQSADVNQDGIVDSLDLAIVAQKILDK